MSVFSRFNAFAAVRDLKLFLRTRERHEYVFAVIALAITGFIIFAFDKDSYFERAIPITYVESWPLTRTDAEIEKGNKQRSQERHAAEAERQRQFKQLADQLGIEVDNKQ